MGLLFVAAIVVAMAVVGWKRLRRTKYDPRYEEDVAPRIVASHAEMDELVHARCTCGGKRIREGEGPSGDVWRVLTKCGSCGRRRALLFRVAS